MFASNSLQRIPSTSNVCNEFRTTIFGEPASKANSRRLVTIGGRARFIKSQKAIDYVAAFKRQCPRLDELLEGDVRVTMRIFYRTRRPDLDESVILDCLEGHAYQNDRQVKEKHIFHDIDKDKPRAEIKVESIASTSKVND
jgi:Holliday junction resolvase RusA-like endonuclease|tara:strand:+ start:1583 stop:2005 length:423 start_codon:yes stop_codon:yes gene_type:complete